METGVLKVEELNYKQFDSLDRDRTLFILPVSSLEVHGPHLPLGTDFFNAQRIGELLAEAFSKARPDWTVALLPPLPVGMDELPLPGSVQVRQRAVRDLVTDYGKSIAKYGFKHIVITNGHGGPRHLVALEEACAKVSKRYGISMVTPAASLLSRLRTDETAIKEFGTLLSRPFTEEEVEELRREVHAGGWETSSILARRPELVDESYKELASTRLPRIVWLDRLGYRLIRLLEVLRLPKSLSDEMREGWDGLAGLIAWVTTRRDISYVGSPSCASPELGRAAEQMFTDSLLDIVIKVVDGELKPEHVHTPLWRLPILRTNFFRYLFGIPLILLLALLIGAIVF